MRIELCAGGIGGISISDFQTDMRSFLSEKEAVIASFKAVSSSTGNLSGGVGSLSGALEDIQARIIREETALEDAKAVQTSMNDFLELAQRVDAQVASDVDRNKEDFYGKYPELRPAPPEDEKAWYEKAWEALCGAGEAIKEAIQDGLEYIADTLKKAWDGLVEFYNEHKKIIDTILIIVGAVLAVGAVLLTGGGALIYLLTVLGCSYGVAAAISATVGVLAIVTTVISSTMNVIDIWCEIENETFQNVRTGMNIASGIFNFVYSIGNTFNSLKGVSTSESIARAKAISNGRKGYGNLNGVNNRLKIGSDRDFSQKQKAMIREENMSRNGGELRCDLTGEKGSIYHPEPGSTKIGYNYLEIDHICPQNLGGANSFDNAQLVLWNYNNAKRANAAYDIIKATRFRSLFDWNINWNGLFWSQIPNFRK